MTTLIADLEANGLLDTATRIHQLSIIDDDTGELSSYNDRKHADGTVEEGLARLAEADRTVWHNGLNYDLILIAKLFPDLALDWTKVVDTLVLSRAGNPEREGGHSLAAWGEELGYVKPHHEDWSRWSPEMEHRCNADVDITRMVWRRLSPMLDEMPMAVFIEHGCAQECALIRENGFRLDVQYAYKLLSDLIGERDAIAAELKETFPPILVPDRTKAKAQDGFVKSFKIVNSRNPLHGKLEPGVEFCPVTVQEFNPGSRKQVADRLIQRHGWKPTKLTDGGEPQINDDVLQDLPYDEAKPLAEFFKLDKLIGQLDSPIKKDGTGGGWLHWLRGDRVHANINSCRAVTARPSCSSPNLQQVSTDPRMRRCWLPREGWKLVGVDAAGAELRCLAHYLWPYDDGAYSKVVLEGDPHTLAMETLGMDLWSKDEDEAMWAKCRGNTKRVEYGWLYGAGDPKIGLIIQQNAWDVGRDINFEALGLKPTKAMSKVGKAARIALLRGITGLADLMEDVHDAADEGFFYALDRRRLWVRSKHSALNLLLQSAAVLIMKLAMCYYPVRLEQAGFRRGEDWATCIWVHDEVQIECRPEIAERVGEIVSQSITDAAKDLGFRLPMAGTVGIGNNWSETH